MHIYNPSNAFCVCTDNNSESPFLVDPWIFSKAYLDGWLPSSFVQDKISFLKLFAELKFVLITHIHEDHFDLNFLSHLASSNVKIIFPRVFGWKYFLSSLADCGLASNAHILDIGSNLSVGNYKITAIGPVNTSRVSDTDHVSSNHLSIDGGFVVTDKDDIKVAFMADNNPYAQDAIRSSFSPHEIDLFCISHSGFASDYPFNYNYTPEQCLEKYTVLENSRQSKQLSLISTLIQPRALLAYSSSYVPNKWVHNNWYHCSRLSQYFNPEDAAKKFFTNTGIPSYGLSSNNCLVVSNDIYIASLDINGLFATLQPLIMDTSRNYDLAISSTASSFDPCDSDSPFEILVSESKQNYYDNLSKYDLKPKFSIRISCPDVESITLSCTHNKPNHTLHIMLPTSILLLLMVGQIHWDTAMLSFLLSYGRRPDYYCAQTYYSLYSFVSPAR